MITPEKHFLYLSQILGRRIYQCDKKHKVGKIDDLVISSKGIYPEVVGIVASKGWNSNLFIPWEKVADFEGDNIILQPSTEHTFGTFAEQNGLLLLKQTFLDKQIVDVSGCKVVRVNDLHLLKESGKLWAAHVDIGFKGLLRRLGCEKSICKIVEWLFSYKIPDIFISWKYVQAITTTHDLSDIGRAAIKLKISHDKLEELHPADLAEILMDLGRSERIAIFRTLDTETTAEVLEELDAKTQHTLFDSLSREKAAEIVCAMPMDEAADLMLTISKKKREDILKLIEKEKADEISKLLVHPEETAGALMTTEFCKFLPTLTIAEILANLRQQAITTEAIYYIYIVDEQNILVGATTLRRLLVSDPQQKISKIMHTQPIKVKTTTKQDRVAKTFIKYSFGAIPVVDTKNKLVGVITIKDALQAVIPQLKQTK